MSIVYDYTTETTIEITNIIDPTNPKFMACDAGNIGTKKIVSYEDIKDKPHVKFDYLLDDTGAFLKGTINEDGTYSLDEEGDYLVAIKVKNRRNERLVPAYRTANAKTLYPATEPDEEGKWIGDSMKFITCNKDEIVFYEKLAYAFKGELEVKINDVVVGEEDETSSPVPGAGIPGAMDC